MACTERDMHPFTDPRRCVLINGITFTLFSVEVWAGSPLPDLIDAVNIALFAVAAMACFLVLRSQSRRLLLCAATTSIVSVLGRAIGILSSPPAEFGGFGYWMLRITTWTWAAWLLWLVWTRWVIPLVSPPVMVVSERRSP